MKNVESWEAVGDVPLLRKLLSNIHVTKLVDTNVTFVETTALVTTSNFIPDIIENVTNSGCL